MLRLVDGRRESVGESRCGVALAMAGIDVTPQVTIRDERGHLVARVDFLVDGTKVVIEFDGKVKYAAGDPAVLWDEKRREDRLRGWVMSAIRNRTQVQGRAAMYCSARFGRGGNEQPGCRFRGAS